MSAQKKVKYVSKAGMYVYDLPPPAVLADTLEAIMEDSELQPGSWTEFGAVLFPPAGACLASPEHHYVYSTIEKYFAPEVLRAKSDHPLLPLITRDRKKLSADSDDEHITFASPQGRETASLIVQRVREGYAGHGRYIQWELYSRPHTIVLPNGSSREERLDLHKCFVIDFDAGSNLLHFGSTDAQYRERIRRISQKAGLDHYYLSPKAQVK